MAVRTKLLVDSVDAYVLSMPSPVNRQRRCLHPVVRERQALVGQLQSILRDLGLERRAKAVPDLGTYLAARAGAPEPGNGTPHGERAGSPEASPDASAACKPAPSSRDEPEEGSK